MLGEIDKTLQYSSYELKLLKPDRTTVAYLAEAYNVVYSPRFAGIDELEFKIPYYISDGKRKIKNPNWDLFRGDYLISLNDEQLFLIDTPQNIGNEKQIKTIHCYSLEYELTKKVIRGYKADSRLLYDLSNSLDDKGIEKGLLNYIMKLTAWSINHIDPVLLSKYRSFDISESTVVEALTDAQKSFGCLFLYDTLEKQINIYEVQSIGQNRGLYITEENYVKTIGEEIKHDEIVTRLYIYGKDDISIHAVNPTGTSYIETFAFYKNKEYMSEGLITALTAYESLLQEKTGSRENPLSVPGTFQYYQYLLNDYDRQITEKEDELDVLENELKSIQNSIDAAISAGQAYGGLNSDKQDKINKINIKNGEINGLRAERSGVENSLSSLRAAIAKENNFTPEQLIELDYFIREKTWSDRNYTDAGELYNEGVKVLQQINQPPVQFEIDVVDFLKISECQHDWHKLVLGDVINLQYKRFDVDIQARLVAYEHDEDGNSLTLEFSNKNSLDDPYIYLNELLSKTVSTSTTLDMSRYKWDKSEQNDNEIRRILNSAWDTAKNAVLAGKDQEVRIDERGISLTDSADSNKSKQLRMLNNVIAMTRDGWNTASLAMTPDGIYAERLIGQILAGEMLAIVAKDGSNYVHFQVDSAGVSLDGGKLTITNGLQENHLSPTLLNRINNYADEVLNDFISNTYNGDLQHLKDQIDGNITTWFYGYEPTLANLPAGDWNTNLLKDTHIGDIFYNTVTGYAYRFAKSDTVYAWVLIKDSDITKALADAANAQDTADNKRRVFVNQPVPPYDTGDLWTGGASGDLKVCITSRTQGSSFSSSDWVYATKYYNALQQSSNYNGVVIDTANGLVVTRGDKKVRTLLNATTGFKIQNGTGSGEEASYTDVLYFDTSGNASFKGIVTATGFKDKNGNSFLTGDGLQIVGSKITSITTDQLVAGTAKISTAMIENLVVGSNVTMGANATISWGQVSSKPFIPQTAGDIGALPSNSQRLTHIGPTGIYTGTVEAEKIIAGTLTGFTILTAGVGSNRIELNQNGFITKNSSNQYHGVYMDALGGTSSFRIFSGGVQRYSMFYGQEQDDLMPKMRLGSQGCPLKIRSGGDMSIEAIAESTIYIGDSNNTIRCGGIWNFVNATVIGVTATAKFA